MTRDPFGSANDSLIAPAREAFAVTPKDTGELTRATKAVYVGTGSHIVLRALGPEANETLRNVAAGSVIVIANDRGTLINNFGIAGVKFEGSEAVITRPTSHTIQTQRGTFAFYGWWVRLRKPAGKAGQANLFISGRPRGTAPCRSA
ncbi:MAG: hypothetical protein O9266_14800 [Porphyrobacter sp.]|nr:hypothetical protein [Porphyrobacter sp.]